MEPLFPVHEEARSQQKFSTLRNLPEFQPPLDLRQGFYTTPKNLPLRRYAGGAGMFWNYMRVVRRDRSLALRGGYSDFMWARSALELMRLFESYGARFDIQGLGQLGREPVVFAVNHMSTLETQTLCGYITPYVRTTFVVKSSLARGYFAPLICSRPYIALERTDPLQDLQAVLREGRSILEAGRSIIIFPQGTREEAQFSRSRFNSIAVRLALEAGVAVLPVALSSSFWSQSQRKITQYLPILHPERPVLFSFGPRLKVEGRGKATQVQVLDYLCHKMEEWGVPVLP